MCTFQFATHVTVNSVESAINPFVINEKRDERAEAGGKSASVTSIYAM